MVPLTITCYLAFGNILAFARALMPGIWCGIADGFDMFSMPPGVTFAMLSGLDEGVYVIVYKLLRAPMHASERTPACDSFSGSCRDNSEAQSICEFKRARSRCNIVCLFRLCCIFMFRNESRLEIVWPDDIEKALEGQSICEPRSARSRF